ncbi:MAG: hypothetical protein JO172_15810 [Hyphomicrobiales bacterium]|nr:hypothetical protein [Hyphomicrobiales bacterium]
MHYDPFEVPDPKSWLALDEQERLDLTRDYHRRARIRVPNGAEELHALFHTVVETQIALGDATPAQRTAKRLMDEGLDRHEAIHAIGSVLAEHIHDLMTKPHPSGNRNPAYFAALENLTAESWRQSG